MALECGHPRECRYSFLEKGVRKIYCFACVINAVGIKPLNEIRIFTPPEPKATPLVDKDIQSLPIVEVSDNTKKIKK